VTKQSSWIIRSEHARK